MTFHFFPSVRQVINPLRWQEWDQLLATYPNQRLRSYLVRGIKEGFRIGFGGETKGLGQSSTHNMPSAREQQKVVDDYLAEECCKGRVLGPLRLELFPQVHPNRFGVIPKGTSGKWRLIVDMSFPAGASVNDGIEEALCSLTYVGIKDAVRGILERGRGTQLAKVDIRSAYRNVPVHPDDRGMIWRESLFVDAALPFGLRSAPKIFTAVADAAEWIVRREGVDFIIHYLDDFLLMAPLDQRNVARHWRSSWTSLGDWVCRWLQTSSKGRLPGWFRAGYDGDGSPSTGPQAARTADPAVAW